MASERNRYLVKLVRDGIPDMLSEGTIEYGPVPGHELVVYLRKKLGEEVMEYVVEGTVDELADVLDVVMALSRQAHGLTLDGLEEIARQKREQRGGFALGIGMYARHVVREAVPDGE